MIRPALAVFAGLMCGVIGQRQARRLREEGANLRRWEQLLRRLGDEMEQHPLSPLPELYARIAPPGPEAPVLARLMAQLGRGSLDSRCQAAEQAAEETALLARAASERAARDAKLHASLGWTCGACLTILLL